MVGERGVEMELFPHLLIRSWGWVSVIAQARIVWKSWPTSSGKLVSVTLILVRFPMIHSVIQLSPLIAKQTRLCEWPTFAVS